MCAVVFFIQEVDSHIAFCCVYIVMEAGKHPGPQTIRQSWDTCQQLLAYEYIGYIIGDEAVTSFNCIHWSDSLSLSCSQQ